ncbi:MAG: integration host factor subunit beta [Proteobacteria bacterium]|nr:integration host factor subunit beta [Pseudomonadota bacterium]
MKRSDIISILAEEMKISQKKSTEIVDFIFDKMREAILKGERIEIRGFGSFYVKSYQPRKGRNPKTGEIIDVLPKKLPFFKVGKELKKKLIEGISNE